MPLDKDLLDILVCPKCKGDVEYICTEEKEELICHQCRLSYPVKDDIPVMLTEEARRI